MFDQIKDFFGFNKKKIELFEDTSKKVDKELCRLRKVIKNTKNFDGFNKKELEKFKSDVINYDLIKTTKNFDLFLKLRHEDLEYFQFDNRKISHNIILGRVAANIYRNYLEKNEGILFFEPRGKNNNKADLLIVKYPLKIGLELKQHYRDLDKGYSQLESVNSLNFLHGGVLVYNEKHIKDIKEQIENLKVRRINFIS